MGVLLVPEIDIVCLYFDKKRTMVVGIACSGVGLGTFIFPPIIRHLIDVYGWRGALMLQGGLVLQICVFGALMRPLPMLVPQSNMTSHDDMARGTQSENEKVVTISETEAKTVTWNLTIFKNNNYLMLLVNNFLFCIGMSIVYVHLGAYANTRGYSDDQAAILFSVVGVSNLVGRIAFGLFAMRVSATILYLVGHVAAGLVTLLVPFVTSYGGLVGYAAFFGFFSATIGTMLPHVIIAILNLELLQSAYGYVTVSEAIGMVLGAPLAGTGDVLFFFIIIIIKVTSTIIILFKRITTSSTITTRNTITTTTTTTNSNNNNNNNNNLRNSHLLGLQGGYMKQLKSTRDPFILVVPFAWRLDS